MDRRLLTEEPYPDQPPEVFSMMFRSLFGLLLIAAIPSSAFGPVVAASGSDFRYFNEGEVEFIAINSTGNVTAVLTPQGKTISLRLVGIQRVAADPKNPDSVANTLHGRPGYVRMYRSKVGEMVGDFYMHVRDDSPYMQAISLSTALIRSGLAEPEYEAETLLDSMGTPLHLNEMLRSAMSFRVSSAVRAFRDQVGSIDPTTRRPSGDN
jgi:hypothetical protein